MLTSYHAHSRWSDGDGEIEEFLAAARDLGLDEVGLSEHYVLSPDGRPVNWSMPLDALNAYLQAYAAAQERAEGDLLGRRGLEVDFFPETKAAVEEALAGKPLDYVIGSVHFLDGFPIDENRRNWQVLTQDERNTVIKGYWTRISQMAESGLFDVVGHLDLTKKFGFLPTVDIHAEVSAALDAIARADMAVEINTAGWYAVCHEVYPEPGIIRACFERKIPVVVTADAHTPAHLTRGFDRAYALLQEIGYRHVACFSERRRISRPMEL